MRIYVRTHDEDSRFRLNLWVPTGIVKSKFIWKQLGKAKGMTPELADKLQSSLSTAYRQIRDYIRTNGHFTLVEAVTEDTYVRITI